MVYKRICKNPDCNTIFSTTIHNQYYCSKDCGKRARATKRKMIFSKTVKVYKCRECGELFFSKSWSATCGEKCADNRRKRLKQLKECEKCRYYNSSDVVPCNYFFETGKLRKNKDYYPCEVKEPKRGVCNE